MKKVLKWIGIVLGSLIGLLLVAALVLYLKGNAQLNKTYDFPPSNLTIPTDAESIARGEHLVTTICMGCHGEDLSGREDFFDGGPLGTIQSENLTSGEGGVGQFFTDEDYVRAIRHGISPDGKFIFMPGVYSTSFLSDEDLAAIIAYVKTVPPVDHVTNGHNFKPLGKILMAIGGILPPMPVEVVSHDVHVSGPPVGVTVEYGSYIMDTHDCRVCHGQTLNGNQYPDPTIDRITPNLTPGGELAFWTEEEFINTIRTGTTPSGYNLDPALMPWMDFRNMSDDELKAVWMYLQSLPELGQYTK